MTDLLERAQRMANRQRRKSENIQDHIAYSALEPSTSVCVCLQEQAEADHIASVTNALIAEVNRLREFAKEPQ